MWKKILIILALTSTAYIASGQSISPRDRAVLDFYYAQVGTGQIDGAWIIIGTISTNKLDEATLTMLIDGSNAWQWVLENDPVLATNFIGVVSDTNKVEFANKTLTITFESNNTDFIELAMNDTTQSLTAAAGFEVVTNMTATHSNNNISATSSNITIDVQSVYRVSFASCLQSSAANTLLIANLFTNGIQADIGWCKEFVGASSIGSASGQGLIALDSGDVLDYRIDSDKNATINFITTSFMAEQKK